MRNTIKPYTTGFMKNILISWIGRTDLNAVQNSAEIGLGPIAQAVSAIPFDQVALLSDYPAQETKSFLAWLTSIKALPVSVIPVTLTSPINFSEIYQEAVAALKSVYEAHGQDIALTFHLSPGTPAIAAVWILLARAIHRASLPGIIFQGRWKKHTITRPKPHKCWDCRIIRR